MASFVLKPCKVRGSKIVQDRAQETIEVDWNELRRLLAPTSSPQSLRVLAQAQTGAFVGLLRSGRFLTNFLLVNPDQSGNISTQLHQNPYFADRIERVYHIVEADLDSSFLEMT